MNVDCGSSIAPGWVNLDSTGVRAWTWTCDLQADIPIAHNVCAKLNTQMVWYGSVRTLIHYGFIHEWLLPAGFSQVYRCGFKLTGSIDHEIASLDNRERENSFVEAIR